MTHRPSSGSQHAPIGGQLAVSHVVPSPWYSPKAASHAAWFKAIEQVPETMSQQAPVGGCGQGLVPLQVVPSPSQEFPRMSSHHCHVIVPTHAPVLGLQHAPTGAQVTCSQVESLPWYSPLAASHAAWEATVHCPSMRLQQAPVGGCGQGFGSQPVPSP